MIDYLDPLRSEIERADSASERHIIDWCVENVVPFSQLQQNDVYLIQYESLCNEPRTELANLFRFLGKSFDDRVLHRFEKVSASSPRSTELLGTSTLSSAVTSWQSRLSTADLNFASRATQAFGLDRLYDSTDLGHAKDLIGAISTPLRSV
jgi:hypothetical protein